MEAISHQVLDEWTRDRPGPQAARAMSQLELALLRRGVVDRDLHRQRCSSCRRTPLVGERIYFAKAGPVLCELCRRRESEPPHQAAVVHGPAFGQTIRIVVSGLPERT